MPAQITIGSIEEMAQFVTMFHWRPADYWSMTFEERAAIIAEVERQNREAKRHR